MPSVQSFELQSFCDSGLRGRSEGQRALKRPDQDLPTVKFDLTWDIAPTQMLRREVNGMLFSVQCKDLSTVCVLW